MYKVTIGTGTYAERQAKANSLGCDLYLEQHINSSTSESPDYGLGVVASNASQKSKDIAAWYAKEAGKRFDVGGPLDADTGYGTGVRIGGRGEANIAQTNMPAVILEPWFASNPKQAQLLNSTYGVERGARLLFDTVKEFYPNGAHVFLSIGHLGNRPGDYGAAIVRTTLGEDRFCCEALWSEQVVRAATVELELEKAEPEIALPKKKLLNIFVNDTKIASTYDLDAIFKLEITID